jgi:hypothetical protein
MYVNTGNKVQFSLVFANEKSPIISSYYVATITCHNW